MQTSSITVKFTSMSDFSYMQFNGRGSVPLIGYYIAFRLPKSNFLRMDHNQKNVS